eukprot:13201_1
MFVQQFLFPSAQEIGKPEKSNYILCDDSECSKRSPARSPAKSHDHSPLPDGNSFNFAEPRNFYVSGIISCWASWLVEFKSILLPEGYPDSVTKDYLQFQIYDTLQAVCSYLRGILATQAILVGVGVGDAEASATSAALQWVVRDLFAMLGSVIFAWHSASSFGSDVKRWRLFADFMNDLGIFLELCVSIFPQHFLLLACLGNLCKAMCGVSSGATRAALSQHFAKHKNISDITVKENIQETIVTMIGLSMGMLFSNWLDGSSRGTWATFFFLTFVHMWANYRAVSALSLRTLNSQRGHLLCSAYFNQLKVPENLRRIPSPSEISLRESVFWTDKLGHKIHLGVPFDEVVHNERHFRKLSNFSPNKSYLVCVAAKDVVSVVVSRHAKTRDLIESFFLTRLVFSSHCAGFSLQERLECAKRITKDTFPLFWEQLSTKHISEWWVTEELYLPFKGWRCLWNEQL